jgi:hypothetical protein
MNKKLLFAGSLLLFIIITNLQAQQPESLWLDVRAGFNTSLIVNQNAYGNGELDYATTFGLTGGPGASYFLSEKWGINASLAWLKLGQNYSGPQSGGDATRKVKLNYIELPILAMRKIEGPKNPAWFAFGPDFMFLTGAKQDYHREDGGPLPKAENLTTGITDIKDRFAPVDIALKISLNKIYDIYENNKLRLLFSADMAYGLTDINHKDWHTPNLKGAYAGSHNFYIGIKAGLMFKAFVKED